MDAFLIEDDDLFEKYNTIWDKVTTDIEKKVGCKLSTIKTFLKTK